jgi:hypothetical protein
MEAALDMGGYGPLGLKAVSKSQINFAGQAPGALSAMVNKRKRAVLRSAGQAFEENRQHRQKVLNGVLEPLLRMGRQHPP